MRTSPLTLAATLFLFALSFAAACGQPVEENGEESSYSDMEGEVADCEFHILTFSIEGGEPVEVSVNGLPVADVLGADKVSADAWEVVPRRGVRLSRIFEEAGISLHTETPVNVVARDGFDPLRTRLGGDASLLPDFGFVTERAYVYVGSPGDKDPLYPEMEGKSLMVDYDLETDEQVPEHLGGTIAALSLFRWKMIEKVDESSRGVIELDPVVE